MNRPNSTAEVIRQICAAIDKTYPEDSSKRERDLCFDLVQQGVDAISKYVSCVYIMDAAIPILRSGKVREDIRAAFVETENETRRSSFSASMAACAYLNSICQKHLNLPWLFFDGDITDQTAVADFCMKMAKDAFSDQSDDKLSEKNRRLREEVQDILLPKHRKSA